MCHVVT